MNLQFPGGTPDYNFVNWAGNFRSRARWYCQPRSVGDLQQILADADGLDLPVRLVGAAHSWSDVVSTRGVIINLDRLYDPQPMAVDSENCLVTLPGGMRLYQINRELDRVGLAMSNLGSVDHQSIAGAISTGTHGSGIRYGNLSTMVRELELVTPSGEKITVHRDDGGDLFKGAGLSLGCLGIITSLTLQVEPAFHLEENRYWLPFGEAMEAVPQLTAEHEHLKLWWLPHTNRVGIYTYNRTDRPVTPSGAMSRWIDDELSNRVLFPLFLKAGHIAPWLIPFINKGVSLTLFEKVNRVDRSHRVFHIPMPPRHLEMEYAVPVEHTVTALRKIRDLIEKRRLKVGFVVEARFVAADDLLISPAYGRDSCFIGAYIYWGSSRAPYFEGFEEIANSLEGRPHWGKEFYIPTSTLASRFPRWNDFATIRRDLDPKGRMANPFIRRLFHCERT